MKRQREKTAVHGPTQEASEGANPGNTLILDSGSQHCEAGHPLQSLKPPRLWGFATVALAHQHKGLGL